MFFGELSMEFNIFAGARRIVYLIAGLVMVYALYFYISYPHEIQRSYSYHDGVFKREPVHWDDCGKGMNYFYAYTKSGHYVRINLCPTERVVYFNKSTKEGGGIWRKVVPTTFITNGMDYETSKRIIDGVKQAFHFSPKDEESIEQQVANHNHEIRQMIIKDFSIFLGILCLFVSLVDTVLKPKCQGLFYCEKRIKRFA